MKIEIKNPNVKSDTGLRRRWLRHAALLACVLGLVCVLLVSAVFSARLYIRQERELQNELNVAVSHFDDRVNKTPAEYYDACVVYTQTCDPVRTVDVQFVDTTGVVVASSSGNYNGVAINTAEVQDALNCRGQSSFTGIDDALNRRVIAVSMPMIATSGDVIGVLRFFAETALIDQQIVSATLAVLAVVIVMVTVFLLCVDNYAKSVVSPLSQIIEKAQMITGGSYGIQLQTKYADEIGDLAQTINELSMRVNQNEKTQTEFISSLSHELRTPLTAITGWSETLLHSEDLDEGTRRGMKIIHREAGRLTEMVISLLDFTRIQDGRMTLNIEPTDLRSEFEDTVFMYGSRLESDGIHLEYLENEDDIPEVSCDPQRMRQVFLNILDNASKHGGEGKRIDAEICGLEDFVEVRIRDYGPGIPEDEIPLVTRKFYKGSSKARGSGIGLAVCEEIVEMHGGQLVLENADGGGTLVTVRIPVS